MKPVSAVRCRDYEKDLIDTAVRRAVGLLGGMEKFIRPGARVLIKPNMLAAKPPEKAVTTHPEVVTGGGPAGNRGRRDSGYRRLRRDRLF